MSYLNELVKVYLYNPPSSFYRITSCCYSRLLLISFVVVITTGCGTASTTSQSPRILELQIKLLSEAGTPIANEPLILSDPRFKFRYQGNQPPIETDESGVYFAVMEYLPHRGTTFLWDFLQPPPNLPKQISFTLKLPQISPKGKYELTLFFIDPELPSAGWDRTGVFDPAFAPSSKLSPDRKLFRSGTHYYAKNGAVYRSFDGSLFRVEMLANGSDTRLVPPMWDEPDLWRYKGRATTGGEPGPRIKIMAKLESIDPYRDRLLIEMVVIYHDHG